MRLLYSVLIGLMVCGMVRAQGDKLDAASATDKPLVSVVEAGGEVDYKTRMQEISKTMNDKRRTLGQARLILRRKRLDLERELPACVALAEEIKSLQDELAAKQEELDGILAKDESYAKLAEAVKQAETGLDTVRKELYDFVQEQKLKKTASVTEEKPSVPQQ